MNPKNKKSSKRKPKRIERTVLIQRRYSDDDRPSQTIIGGVFTSLTEHELNLLWLEWRDEVEYPDSDSQFIDWLIENHGCQRAEETEIATIPD